MVKSEEIISLIITKFSRFEQVEAITLAGSNAFNTNDESSDIDIDIYINNEIPVTEREAIAKEFADYMEIDNQFWGPGDEWKLRDLNLSVDIIYLDMMWIRDYLERVVVRHEAGVGFTTCFWHNVVDSKVVYDRNGELCGLQKNYMVNYPQKLKENIVAKNYPILRRNMSSYYYQIEKAVKRNDLVSINHRVSALLASYFDILFAVNEMRHPGEKKLLKIIDNSCRKIPNKMEKNITAILHKSTSVDNTILLEIDDLVYNLDELLMAEGISF